MTFSPGGLSCYIPLGERRRAWLYQRVRMHVRMMCPSRRLASSAVHDVFVFMGDEL